MSPMRILVIEDEKKTAAFLAKGLREAGFDVDVASDGETGLEQARATKFDLLIVDIMGGCGCDFRRRRKRPTSHTGTAGRLPCKCADRPFRR